MQPVGPQPGASCLDTFLDKSGRHEPEWLQIGQNMYVHDMAAPKGA